MAVPIADVEAPPNWTEAPLFEGVNSRHVNIRGAGLGEAVVRFGPVARVDPNHVFELRVRYRSPNGGRLNCRLYNGTTELRTSRTPAALSEWQEHIITLNKRKSDQFTDLSDVRLGLEPNGPNQIIRVSLCSFGSRYPSTTPLPADIDTELFQPLADKCEALGACWEAIEYLNLKGSQTIRAALEDFRAEPDRVTHLEYGKWAWWAVKNIHTEPEYADWVFNVITRVACESITRSDMMILRMFRAAKHRLPPPAKQRCRDRFQGRLPEAEQPEDSVD